MEMAHIRKRNGKWIAEVRKKDFKKIQKTFLKKSNATNWVQEIEYQMDKNQYEDFSDSSKFTLGDLIKKYRDEITVNKKGVLEETYKLNLLLRNKIAKCRLLEIKTNHIYDFKKDTYTSYLDAAIKKSNIRTITDGKGMIFEDGSLFLQEHNYGRLIYFNSDGSTKWEYVNRADDGFVYQLRWARIFNSPEELKKIDKILNDGKK